MNKLLIVSLSFCIIALLTSFETKSTLLVAGDTIALSGTTAAAQPELVSAVINDNSIYGFATPSGSPFFGIGVDVQNRVGRSTTDGSLTFAPRIIPVLNNTGANFLIDTVTLSGFSSFMLDVNYRTDGLGDRGPNMASRSFDGDILTFDFLFPLVVSNLFGSPQEQSYFFSINSNATAYANTGSMQIFGRHLNYPGETFELNYSGIAVPVLAQVSEPATGSVFLMFFACLALRIIRK